MNFGLIVEAIRFASEHKEDIAAGGHAAIAGIQAVEALCHKHNKPLDHVLHVADRVFDAVAHPPPGTAPDSRNVSGTWKSPH